MRQILHPRAAFKNVASTLHAVHTKYDQYFNSERLVREDAPSWAHFLFVYSEWAVGRALCECMKENALFFMH